MKMKHKRDTTTYLLESQDRKRWLVDPEWWKDVKHLELLFVAGENVNCENHWKTDQQYFLKLDLTPSCIPKGNVKMYLPKGM